MGESWRRDAACAGMPVAMFYAENYRDDADAWHDVRAAKQVCRSCKVQMECLAYAVESVELYGVWGGATPNERVEIRVGRVALADMVSTDF